MRNVYTKGHLDALRDFGFAKEAAAWSRPWSEIGRDALHSARLGLIGEPINYGKEILSGNALKPGSLLRNMFTGSPGTGFFQRALPLAGTALSTAAAIPYLANLPSSQKGEGIGNFAGQLIGGIAGSPMGLAGNMAGSTLGGIVGGHIGSLFNSKEAPQPQQIDQLSEEMGQVTKL